MHCLWGGVMKSRGEWAGLPRTCFTDAMNGYGAISFSLSEVARRERNASANRLLTHLAPDCRSLPTREFQAEHHSGAPASYHCVTIGSDVKALIS